MPGNTKATDLDSLALTHVEGTPLSHDALKVKTEALRPHVSLLSDRRLDGGGGCCEREAGSVPGRRRPNRQRRAQGSGPWGEVRFPGETSPLGSCLQGETKMKTNQEKPHFSFICMLFAFLWLGPRA